MKKICGEDLLFKHAKIYLVSVTAVRNY